MSNEEVDNCAAKQGQPPLCIAVNSVVRDVRVAYPHDNGFNL